MLPLKRVRDESERAGEYTAKVLAIALLYSRLVANRQKEGTRNVKTAIFRNHPG